MLPMSIASKDYFCLTARKRSRHTQWLAKGGLKYGAAPRHDSAGRRFVFRQDEIR